MYRGTSGFDNTGRGYYNANRPPAQQPEQPPPRPMRPMQQSSMSPVLPLPQQHYNNQQTYESSSSTGPGGKEYGNGNGNNNSGNNVGGSWGYVNDDTTRNNAQNYNREKDKQR